jgi:DNA-binding LytR/AlgR family response regulator
MNSYNINVLTENGKTTIDCSKILYVESSLQFSRVTMLDDKTIELLLTLQEVEYMLLEQGFFKMNNRFLVNLKYVEVVFPSNASKIIMENGKEVLVNYTKREELFENLRQVYELHELV